MKDFVGPTEASNSRGRNAPKDRFGHFVERYSFVGLLVALLVYTANFALAIWGWSEAGTFGDTFGAVNAFFSGAAFVFLFYAVALQRQEIFLVKDERNDTREILRQQESLIAEQKKALNLQTLEGSFFSIIGSLQSERRSLEKALSSMEGWISHCIESWRIARINGDTADDSFSIEGRSDASSINQMHSFSNLFLSAHKLITRAGTFLDPDDQRFYKDILGATAPLEVRRAMLVYAGNDVSSRHDLYRAVIDTFPERQLRREGDDYDKCWLNFLMDLFAASRASKHPAGQT